MKITGIILIVVGVLALAYQGFTYSAPHKDAQIGSLEIQHNEEHAVYLPPVVGVICLAAGGLILLLGSRRSM